MLWLRIIAVGILLAGLIIIHNGIQLYEDAQAMLAWPTAAGTILTSEVRDSGTFETPYSAGVTYRYTIGNRSLTGHRLTNADDRTSSYAEVAQIIEKYPVDSHVTVYYNPTFPRESLLLPGEAPGATILFAVGTVTALLGVYLLQGSFRISRDTTTKY